MQASSPDVRAVEAALQYEFKDPGILLQALTHRSYAAEHPEAGDANNERLEFLGDAILHFTVADELFRRFPDYQEGALTAVRAALVSAPALAAVAEGARLGDYIRASRGEATLGGRGRQSILADACEAVIAAVYQDGGIRAARRVVRRLLVPRINGALARQAEENAKGRLQERVQASDGITPFYRVVERTGPVHAEQFVVEVLAGERVLGRGEGVGKRQAEQHAARQALEALDGGAECQP